MKVELATGGKTLAEVQILRGIFHGNALSSLLFVKVIMSLNPILRKCTVGVQIDSIAKKINHLMYMDNIKLFAKNKEETIRIYSQDIGMEFGREKCAILIMRSQKRYMEGIELQNQKKYECSEKRIFTSTWE